MEDSEREYKRRHVKECEEMQEMMELSTAEDVYGLELDVKQEVNEKATEERAWAPWSPPSPSPYSGRPHPKST
ncbi:hypothetical protein D1007_34372 [Hordeum vulgare]|nr:hypothetical protein D1007_34372 [Hordeum vulgare]